jgi:hypothetical protein
MKNYFLEKYENCEKINFNQFEINDDNNRLILNKLSELILDFDSLNETITVVGGIGLFLKYNKIYRSFKDVDLLIPNNVKTKLKYLNYFNNKLLVRKNGAKFDSLKEYLQFFLKYDNNNKVSKYSEFECLTLSLFPEDLSYQIDLIPFSSIDTKIQSLYTFYDTFNNIRYGYRIPLKYIDYRYSYNRDIDKIDIEFYEKYLKNS